MPDSTSQGDDSIQTCLTMSTGTVVGRHQREGGWEKEISLQLR